ncbi:putative oxidoreductase ucpA [Hyaloscypha variabilis F]|uniref:Putative oxidoreductase ucpA n=1 Tax=Hyaloscypha variabilis (strain UAMH 11265 / GT02V1 / F) TaxID=1149755 RepID=A0A2J6RWA1_HYAVF|nr:putative oxidoreductase ucpA [Hyaloscypha variabilis F]
MTPKEISKEGFAFPEHTGYYFTPTQYHLTPNLALSPSIITLPPQTTACITGAGRGLGESMALGFAQAGAGGVIICSRSTSELEEVAAKIRDINEDLKVTVVKCDVSNEEEVKNLAAVIEKEHGRLDVLINNAGYLDAGWQPITSGPADDWKRVFDVNVFGVYLVTRNLLPLLLESEKGLKTVIGVTSMSSHWAGHSIAMGMSKLALNRFVEFLAGEYGEGNGGLMSYALHPGGVKTRMSQEEGKVPKELQGMSKDSPELCAGMAVWLAKEPRPWLNGRYVAANWDVDELEDKKDEIVEGDKLKFRMVV